METIVPVSTFDLLWRNAGLKRTYQSCFGQIGELFKNFDGIASRPRCNIRILAEKQTNGMVFDNLEKEWVRLTDELIDETPPSFTYSPKPFNLDMELDYFLRSAGLIKHMYVWSVDGGIPREMYAAINSSKNKVSLGRYTVLPWAPSIKELPRIQNGFFINSANDRRIIYGFD